VRKKEKERDTSGAAYWGVPQKKLSFVLGVGTIVANPKSPSFRRYLCFEDALNKKNVTIKRLREPS
jgi:hypothetical protein